MATTTKNAARAFAYPSESPHEDELHVWEPQVATRPAPTATMQAAGAHGTSRAVALPATTAAVTAASDPRMPHGSPPTPSQARIDQPPAAITSTRPAASSRLLETRTDRAPRAVSSSVGSLSRTSRSVRARGWGGRPRHRQRDEEHRQQQYP